MNKISSNSLNDDEVFDFGRRLQSLRKARGLSQKEVASRLDVHKNTVSGYENNTRMPTLDKLITLAVLYNTSLDYMVGFDNRSSIFIDDMPESKQTLVKYIVKGIREECESAQN